VFRVDCRQPFPYRIMEGFPVIRPQALNRNSDFSQAAFRGVPGFQGTNRYVLVCVRGGRAQTDRVRASAEEASRSFQIASSTTTSEVANRQHAIRKDRSTPVSVIGRAVKSPTIPVHQ
jgi:hypothetical protein